MSHQEDMFDEIEGLILEDAKKTYSSQVIDHFMHPRNLGVLESPQGFNVMTGVCGDTIGIYVSVEKDIITNMSFITNGCGPTIACSSAITSMAKGRPVSEAMKITSNDLMDYLGGLPLENTHCADLAVNAMKSALAKAIG